MEVLYEDNHIIVVNKACGEIVQGDRTGDEPLVDMVKRYIKEKYNKPGNVFCGVVHRIDRPTSGLVAFARTSKGLERMNALFRSGNVHKTYWAIVKNRPPRESDTLTSYLTPIEQGNRTLCSPTPVPGSQKSILKYRIIGQTDSYYLLEIDLLTGRKHQIRTMLSSIGCPIKGDLKYGAPRSNPGGGISLQSHRIHFEHPVSHIDIDITAPTPPDPLWQALAASVAQD